MEPKKSRILYVKQFLETQTDENHTATVSDIIAYLGSIGITAGRKAVTQDIEELIEFGIDIINNAGKPIRYFVGERHFELPELKLLVDAVQASQFISVKKSKALIEKLTALGSNYYAGELDRFLYTDERLKAHNENVYIAADLLRTAISVERQVTFKYYEYNSNHRKVYKHNRQTYRVSPYGLIWNTDRYYLVGWSETHGEIAKFRVDRIAVPKLTDISSAPKPAGFDMAIYANSVFQMFGNEAQEVTLLCENELMDSVVDRFGENFKLRNPDNEHFAATVQVAASPTFFGWVFSFCGRMRITAPADVADSYIAEASSAALKAR
jgi:predicted DNA-binding transcriptional regulator YafY